MIKIWVWLMLLGSPAWAVAQNVSGEWGVELFQFGGEADRAVLVLHTDGKHVSGSLNELKLEGTIQGSALALQASGPDGKPFGEVQGILSGNVISGRMRCNPHEDTLCDWKAIRIDKSSHAPQSYVFDPTEYYRLFSDTTKPVLRIRSGDTVKTTTIDAGGIDSDGKRRALGAIHRQAPSLLKEHCPAIFLQFESTNYS